MDMPIDTNNPLLHSPYLENSSMTQEPARVSAYAKLIFEDGYFYMNTYSVILGRDLKAWHAAMRKEMRRQRQIQEGRDCAGDLETTIRAKHEGSRYSKSIVSESGGMLRAGNDSDSEGRVRLRKLRKINKASEKSKFTGSSSPSSRKTSTMHMSKSKVYEAQNLQSTILPVDEPVPVDPATFRPSPYDCPLVAIHPPATAPISAYKSISREHVKIAFNRRKCYFEAHILGRNGCFVQDQWYHTNEIVPLKSGDILQVGGITVQFMLPNLLDKAKKKNKSKGSDPQIESNSDKGVIDGITQNSIEPTIETIDSQQPHVSRKNKVGRPRKHPLPDNLNEPPREKRKYTKRKPKEPRELKDVNINGSGSGEDKKAKKEKVPSKPPRSPSPVMNEEDFTPEQLAKPQANYVTLIHEALSNAPTQQLGLSDIYRAIYRKYPYFKIKTQTLGWQSSVRHNLSQHHAFRKVEKDGKGWTWGIVEGISIEKEKKRRASPPAQTHLGLQPASYQNGLSKIAGQYTFGAPNGSPHTELGHFSNYQLPPRMNGQPSSVINPPSIPLHLAAPNVPTSYHSPYAPRQTNVDTSNQSGDQGNEIQDQSNANLSSTIKYQQDDKSQGDESHSKVDKILSQDISAERPSLDNIQLNEDVIRAAEAFKKNLIDSLKSKQSQMIVSSAVNRVLGISSQSEFSGNPQEEMIVDTLRTLLSKIPGYKSEFDTKISSSQQTTTQLSDVIHSPYQSAVLNAQSTSKTTVNDTSIVAVARPTFTSQGLNKGLAKSK
ncbi:putative forkhead domain-containing protein [Erysiphe neolycopersici]|uniref:Putative forkhead domain-containing protein n=1 Tax=Erysiphe neolycopersici TaxID=212602 RepID=A0A420I3Y9_9PEZI|nr:putative forkhead domain-containing protein [Erysiphe neolycopersici]